MTSVLGIVFALVISGFAIVGAGVVGEWCGSKYAAWRSRRK